jgi:glycosyltransferase involved in cell wall biosynthesis
MRIGVDGYNLALKRGTGIASYARTLTFNLRQMGHQVDVIYGMNISARTSIDLREVIFFDSLDQDHNAKMPKVFSANWFATRRGEWFGFDAVEVPITGRVENRGFAQRLPAYDRILNVPSLFRQAARHFKRTKRFLTIRVENPPEIMHWTYPLPIRLADAKNIYTVHDLVPLRLPYTTLDDKGVHYRLIKEICENADMVCTVSEASRHDIISFFPEASDRVFNTFQAISPDRGGPKPGQLALELAQFGLAKDDYFLFFGSLEPKKNLARLIEAFLASPTKRLLVVVGAMAWKAEDEMRLFHGEKPSERIRRLEYLPETALKSLIRGARAVLFPSLTEGFGLPVLEALSLGTPVLTSREGALPEVGGDAAVYADAYDISSITDGITKLDIDDALCAELQTKGPVQAEQFSSKSYQHKLSEMYQIVSSI